MLELRIKKEDQMEKIALVENGNLIEYYEESKEMNRREGNIYVGIVKDIIKGMQSAFVDIATEKNSFIHLKDVLPKIDETKEKKQEKVDIKDVIKPNQKILVQVKKDSNEKKGARVSTHISLPSNYIVLMPNTDIVTVSQKIEDKEEQQRLVELVKENLSQGNGAVIRTSAMGKTGEIIADIQKIEKKWDKILQQYQNDETKQAKLVYQAENIVEKILIDLSDKKIEKIVTNDTEIQNKLQDFMTENQELNSIRIEQQTKEDIFYGLTKQIEDIEKRKVWLKCGGFITIDKTEALTAIDVNTGKYTGTKDLEQTVYKVNQEATIEIAKQLKLRDIGGIIIIDYIDMQKQENKEKIQTILEQRLKEDRSKTQIEGFTKLDLMEMTRKHICSHKE